MEGSLRPWKELKAIQRERYKNWGLSRLLPWGPLFLYSTHPGALPCTVLCIHPLVDKLKLWNYDAGAPDAKERNNPMRLLTLYKLSCWVSCSSRESLGTLSLLACLQFSAVVEDKEKLFLL
jgi:hypothetical protein